MSGDRTAAAGLSSGPSASPGLLPYCHSMEFNITAEEEALVDDIADRLRAGDSPTGIDVLPG